MVNILKADLFRIGKDRIWIIVLAALLIVFTIPGLYTLQPMGGMSLYDQDLYMDLDEYVESRLPDYGVEYAYELTTEQYREIVFSLEGYKTDVDIICGVNFPLFEVIVVLEVLLVTRDFSVHSIKNTLSSPIHRKTYYFAKYAAIMLLSVSIVVVVNLMVWIANMIINGSERSLPFGTLTVITLLSLMPLTAYVSMIHAVAFLIRKSLPYSLVTIGTTLVAGNILLNILLILGGGSARVVNLIAYLPSMMYSAVTCTNAEDYVPYIYICIALCVTLTAVSLTGGYLFFKNREIK